MQGQRAKSRVFIRTNVVWELLDRLDMSQNELPGGAGFPGVICLS